MSERSEQDPSSPSPSPEAEGGVIADDGAGFHAGERAVQDLYGLGARMAAIGPQVLRDHMPDQHRVFFMALPFVLVGSVDAGGLPWASLLAGPAGFIQAPDPRVLSITATIPAGDPLADHLVPGAALGLLGIVPETRRRNRLNGRVLRVRSPAEMEAEGAAPAAIDPTALCIDILVDQCFGNCPRFIRPRVAAPGRGGMTQTPPVAVADRLSPAAREMIAAADTLFVASAADSRASGRAAGVDVSHRGGPRGFAVVEADGAVTVPDYAGNRYFNTLGNMVLRPAAGILVPDFLTGDLLSLSGDVEIIWQGPELRRHPGAERLWRLRPRRVIHMAGAWGARLRETDGRGMGIGVDGVPA